MYLHRNSQRRIYFDDAIYFVTSTTYNRYPFFKERIFCDVFIENLRLCEKIKGFKLYGWFLGYDHFHLLIKPNDEFNYSKVMQFLKRNFSRNINFIMGDNKNDELKYEGANDHSHLRDIIINKFVIKKFILKFRFKIKYLNKNPFPIFRWQKSYHDHVIRDESDFDNHIQYIQHNPIKHGLPDDWKYIYTDLINKY